MSSQSSPLILQPLPLLASRFNSAMSEEEALARGRRILEADIKAGSVLTFPEQPNPFLDESSVPSRHTVVVTTSRPEGFGEGWMPQRKDGRHFDYNPEGTRISVKSPIDPLFSAVIVWEYAGSKNEWNQLTYYPIAGAEFPPSPTPYGVFARTFAAYLNVDELADTWQGDSTFNAKNVPLNMLPHLRFHTVRVGMKLSDVSAALSQAISEPFGTLVRYIEEASNLTWTDPADNWKLLTIILDTLAKNNAEKKLR